MKTDYPLGEKRGSSNFTFFLLFTAGWRRKNEPSSYLFPSCEQKSANGRTDATPAGRELRWEGKRHAECSHTLSSWVKAQRREERESNSSTGERERVVRGYHSPLKYLFLIHYFFASLLFIIVFSRRRTQEMRQGRGGVLYIRT